MKNSVLEEITGGVNLFADLGLPNADQRFLKVQLAAEIAALIRARNWTQEQAATHLGLPQPRVSALIRGQISGLSLSKLMECANRMGHSIEVRLRSEEVTPQEAHTQLVLV